MVQLVMQLRSMSYREAIQVLEETGTLLTIPEVRERNLRELEIILHPPTKRRLPEVDITPYMHGRSWWRYVRGFSEPTIRQFSLGYDGKNRRAIIPVGFRGKWVGLIKRATNDNQVPKYLYDKDFPKARILFGWDLVPHDENECILVEGATDTIRGHGFDYRNVLGLLGTAVTDDQLHLIASRFDSVILMMDNDPAGAIAMLRNAERLSGAVSRVFVAVFDEVMRKDPDELTLNEWWQVLQGKRHWTTLLS
jgi:5S rRNA maturation endonuclease (ribonuclease M5)